MTETPINLQAYFDRIGYRGGGEVSAQTLRELHRGHVFHIPFENLNPLGGKTVSLDPSDLFDKMVTDKRGGYCFEMNGLLSFVLESLGFPVRRLLARVWRDEMGYGAKTHQILLVTADGKDWICDVGFGGNGLLEPLLFETGTEQQQEFQQCRIVEEPAVGGFAYQCVIDGSYKNIYGFTLEPCSRADYELSNYFTSTHPDSIFTKVPMLMIPTQSGRITVFDHQMKLTDRENVTEISIESEDQMKRILKEYFGIE